MSNSKLDLRRPLFWIATYPEGALELPISALDLQFTMLGQSALHSIQPRGIPQRRLLINVVVLIDPKKHEVCHRALNGRDTYE